MEEIWKDCFGYTGYLASNRGRIKDLNFRGTGKEKIRKLTRDKYGYLQVGLWKDGKRKNELVHRVIAQTFLQNPHNYRCVNHIYPKLGKDHNYVSNLEWCNHKQNMGHAKEHGLIAKGEKNGQAKITEAIVIEIFRLYNVENWSHRKIAKHLGICHAQVGHILRRKYWSTVDIPAEYL